MEKAIKELIKLKITSSKDLMVIKRKISKKYGISVLKNSDILFVLQKLKKTDQINFLQKLLRKRAVRTMSGIAPVAVLTKPFACPGKCAYCPTEKNVPQSYLSNEPAVMRAIRCGYDPYKQVQLRLRALEANGHEPTKIELIVIGGTWSVLPDKYKYWYIKECFRGANNYKFQETNSKKQKYNLKIKIEKLKKELLEEQKKNEKAKYKIIGLTLETRPDYINEKELLEMRELGCTRVELGVQAIDDKILKLNQRGHGVDKIISATRMLKDFGFKVTYHLMPGLPGSTPAKDLKMFKQLFSDENFQPDQIKFYPTVVTKGSLLYKWWKAGKYKPYSDKVLQKLIVDCKKNVPEYVRIIRLIRDIPGESIIAGNKITNLRQVMKDRGVKCSCIRCREAGEKQLTLNNLQLTNIKYKASGGEEYFIQAVNNASASSAQDTSASFPRLDSELGARATQGKDNVLFGFCRLRLNVHNAQRITHNTLEGAALVRELHVYGELVSVGASTSSAQGVSTGFPRLNFELGTKAVQDTSTSSVQGKKIQHAGLGKRLMIEAEKIAKKKGFKKIAVISGVGVRGYYKKLGYKLRDSYMVKELKK